MLNITQLRFLQFKYANFTNEGNAILLCQTDLLDFCHSSINKAALELRVLTNALEQVVHKKLKPKLSGTRLTFENTALGNKFADIRPRTPLHDGINFLPSS